MATIAIYQVAASRDMKQDSIKLVLEALGLSAEAGEDVVQKGSIVYTQRDYKDFASILGTVTIQLTIGGLKEGVSKKSVMCF